VQVHHPLVAPEVPPHPYRLGERRLRQRTRGGEPFEERLIEGDGALHLYLLEHHLRDQHAPGVPRLAPGQVPPVLLEPGDQSFAHRLKLRGVVLGLETDRVHRLLAHERRVLVTSRLNKGNLTPNYQDLYEFTVGFACLEGGAPQMRFARGDPLWARIAGMF
jgi:hypothetical protein